MKRKHGLEIVEETTQISSVIVVGGAVGNLQAKCSLLFTIPGRYGVIWYLSFSDKPVSVKHCFGGDVLAGVFNSPS